MTDPTDDNTAFPFAMWSGGMTGTDIEFLVRSGSILELATGMHHLAVMADSYVADHDRLSATDIVETSRSAQAVAPNLRERFARQLDGFMDIYKQRIDSHLDHLDPDSVGAEIKDPFQWVVAQLASPIRESFDDTREVLSGLSPEALDVGIYLMQYGQALDRRPLLPTMQRALLITAVASTETSMINILRRIQYDDGGDARWGPMFSSPSLDKQMRGLTRGNIEDWVPRLRKDIGVDLPAASCDWNSVREIWARRHVLVHNGGVVDTKYVARVSAAVEGTLLEVDGDYLRNAIDLLCGFVLGLILTTWAALPERAEFVTQLADMYAAVAQTELRWPLAENLNLVAARIEGDAALAAANQANAWIARTHWRGPDLVLDDVRQWRTDELPSSFAIARFVLIDECDAATRMLPEALRRGDLTRDDLVTWPIFDRLRGREDFQLLLMSD